ncbi:MAG: acyl-CoA dehydrogenase family protein, partial [Gammaproteobacteria bacterium]
MEYDDIIEQVRQTVARICIDFPGEYWRAKDRNTEYPGEFVQALTDAGLLACLIPEEFGGSGLPLKVAAEIVLAIHENGANAAACHAQMYTMGTLLKHGSPEQKTRFLPSIASGELRLQAFGVTEPTAGTDTTSITTTAVRDGDRYMVNGQ